MRNDKSVLLVDDKSSKHAQFSPGQGLQSSSSLGSLPAANATNTAHSPQKDKGKDVDIERILEIEVLPFFLIVHKPLFPPIREKSGSPYKKKSKDRVKNLNKEKKSETLY